MNNLNNGDLGLAAFIDQDQQSERQATYCQQVQPVEVKLKDGLELLPTHPARLAAIRQQEGSQRVEDGKLFHGRLDGYELKKNKDGIPFLKFDATLSCNGWRMSYFRNLPKSSIGTTEGIAAARDEILADLGFDPASKDDPTKPLFPETKLFQIQDWKSPTDGKIRHKIGRVFRDAEDYNGYVQWLWDKEHSPKKQQKFNSVELPKD